MISLRSYSSSDEELRPFLDDNNDITATAANFFRPARHYYHSISIVYRRSLYRASLSFSFRRQLLFSRATTFARGDYMRHAASTAFGHMPKEARYFSAPAAARAAAAFITILPPMRANL